MDLRPFCWRGQTDLSSSRLNVWPGNLDGPTFFLFSLRCVSQLCPLGWLQPPFPRDESTTTN